MCGGGYVCLDQPTDPPHQYTIKHTQARMEQELEKLREVKAKGQQVKQAVNKLYRSLEVRRLEMIVICIHVCC